MVLANFAFLFHQLDKKLFVFLPVLQDFSFRVEQPNEGAAVSEFTRQFVDLLGLFDHCKDVVVVFQVLIRAISDLLNKGSYTKVSQMFKIELV